MPEVHRSFYTDMVHGGKYWTYVSEELPAIVQSMFPVSGKREDTYAAGLSMGGYGAFKLALAHPERFVAAASLSGAVDIATRFPRVPVEELPDGMLEVFGDLDDLPGSPNDLLYLARRVVESGGPTPRLYQCCGTEDFLYEHNVHARDVFRSLGLDLTYDEGPGDHQWGYWDREIQNVLAWMLG
jgi:S-formylglutathione hydrolase FrmB